MIQKQRRLRKATPKDYSPRTIRRKNGSTVELRDTLRFFFSEKHHPGLTKEEKEIRMINVEAYLRKKNLNPIRCSSIVDPNGPKEWIFVDVHQEHTMTIARAANRQDMSYTTYTENPFQNKETSRVS